MGDPASGLELCLVGPARSEEPFDDHLAGLDHLELLVDDYETLLAWVEHLDSHDVTHSGANAPEHSRAAMVTFRDLDNIQLELFCPER